jgi:hypothetical protein
MFRSAVLKGLALLEGSMKRYTVDSKFVYWLYVVIMPCLFLALGLIFLVIALGSPASGPPLWFLVFWVAAVLYSGYRTVSMPHTIEVASDGLINFTGPFGRTTVASHDIIRIKAFSGQFLELKHTCGKFWMLQQITGLHEFLSDLKSANRGVTFKGC